MRLIIKNILFVYQNALIPKGMEISIAAYIEMFSWLSVPETSDLQHSQNMLIWILSNYMLNSILL